MSKLELLADLARRGALANRPFDSGDQFVVEIDAILELLQVRWRREDLDLAIALGIILLGMSFVSTLAVLRLQGGSIEE